MLEKGFVLASALPNPTADIINDELLASHGFHDLDRYSVRLGTTQFIPYFFVD